MANTLSMTSYISYFTVKASIRDQDQELSNSESYAYAISITDKVTGKRYRKTVLLPYMDNHGEMLMVLYKIIYKAKTKAIDKREFLNCLFSECERKGLI